MQPKFHLLCAACFASLLVCDPALSASEPLHVMLQGSSADAMRELVVDKGGSITHDLHIIDAVGARMTRSQLDEVLKSPLVIRHIADLSMSEQPPEEPAHDDKSCDVGGAVELDFDHTGIRWTLYNKRGTPATMAALQLEWPDFLGAVEVISLGGSKIDPALYGDNTDGLLEVKFSQPSAPEIEEATDLHVSFKAPQTNASGAPLRQGDFTLEASFHEDCATKLIPGYENNHLDFYYPTVAGADALHLHGITGRGITVAVLDSGLWEHEALARDTRGKPRIVARYDAIKDTPVSRVFDESGHGTHMTSVLAHSGTVVRAGEPTGSFKGIAPDASLVVVKAFDVEGQGFILDIVRGVQWVVDNRENYGIRVLNLSFAARPRWAYWQDPINQAVMRAWASGITVVAAAGNEGPEAMTIGSPGNVPYIITVGATTDSWTPDTRDDDYIPDFSSRGPTPSAHIKPDIVAPGGHITGITRPGSSLTREHPDYLLSSGEFVMTGSSQASALVSGIVALLLQLEPDLSPDDVKCKLLSSAEPAINVDGLLAYSPFQQGHGQVSATRAVTLGQKGCGNTGLNIQQEIAGLEHFEGPAIIDEDGSASLPGLHAMVSTKPSEKGLSTSRRWGVKDHIERETHPDIDPNSVDVSPFGWPQLYLLEKAAIENLGNKPAN